MVGKIQKREDGVSLMPQRFLPAERAEEFARGVSIVVHPDRLRRLAAPAGSAATGLEGEAGADGEAVVEEKLRQLRDVLRETVSGAGPEVPVLFEIHEQGKIFTVDCNGTRIKAVADLQARVGRVLGDEDCCTLSGPRRLTPVAPEPSAEIPLPPRPENEPAELEMVH